MKPANTFDVFRLHIRLFFPPDQEEDFHKAFSSFAETLQNRSGVPSDPTFFPQPTAIDTVNGVPWWPCTWAEITNTNFATTNGDVNVASQDETKRTIVARGKRKRALLRRLPPARTGLKEPPGCLVPKQRQAVIFRPTIAHISHIKEKEMAAHLTQVTGMRFSKQT